MLYLIADVEIHLPAAPPRVQAQSRTRLHSVMGEAEINQILKNPADRLVFCFEAWRLCGLTPLSQPLAELASFASGQSQIVGFVFPELTLLSHGEPHVRKTTPGKTKPRALSYSGFSFLEAWR